MCRIKQNIYFEFVVLKYKVLFSLINQSGKHFVYVVSPIFSIHYFWCNVSCNVFFVWNAFRKYYWSGLNNYQMCFYPLIHSQITCLHWAYCICKIKKLYVFFSPQNLSNILLCNLNHISQIGVYNNPHSCGATTLRSYWGLTYAGCTHFLEHGNRLIKGQNISSLHVLCFPCC